ncbi:hypothetical protein WICPIJ_009045 [Wickerhamomyces pijperi]|uniref:Uncharacterized protein n=1 Tax=Wickerhamomyces pijperi TaxID=599730 RepID=A0A9P8PQQ2_WICPI|nr:hypothetical protein WICPIJ_009045 [Wickerhamomyces pijperi]
MSLLSNAGIEDARNSHVSLSKPRGFRQAFKLWFHRDMATLTDKEQKKDDEPNPLETEPTQMNSTLTERAFLNYLRNRASTIRDYNENMEISSLIPLSRMFLERFPEELQAFNLEKRMIKQDPKRLANGYLVKWKTSKDNTTKNEVKIFTEELLDLFAKKIKEEFTAITLDTFIKIDVLQKKVCYHSFTFKVENGDTKYASFRVWKMMLKLFILEEQAFSDRRYEDMMSMINGLTYCLDKNQITVKLWLNLKFILSAVQNKGSKFGYDTFDQTLDVEQGEQIAVFSQYLYQFLKSNSKSYQFSANICMSTAYAVDLADGKVWDAQELGLLGLGSS